MPETVGIEITANDKASRVLRKVGTEGKKSLDSVAKSAKAVSSQVSDMDKTFEKFTATAAAGVAWTMAVTAMSQAMGALGRELVTTLPTLEDLNAEFSATDARLASISLTLQDEAFQNLNFLAKGMALAFAALNEELAETEAMLLAQAQLAVERQRRQDAVNAGLDDEATALTVNTSMAQKLAEVQARAADASKRRGAERLARQLEESRILIERTQQEAAIIAQIEASVAQEKAIRDAHLQGEFSRIDALVARRAQAAQMQLALDESIALRQAELTEAQAVNYDNLSAVMITTIGGAFTSMASGAEGAGKAMTGAVLSVAEKAIIAHAATAGAGAGSAVSAIPIIGPALIPAAIAAAFGLVRASLSQLPGFQFGGVVQGGTPNRDSVPAMLTPGERVLTRRERAEFESRDRGPAAPAPTSLTVVAPVQNPQEMNRDQMRRWVLSIAPVLEEAVAEGSILKGLQRA